MSAVAVKKKVPKKKSVTKRRTAKKKRSVFHPLEQAKIIREPRVPTPLMDFINSLDGELGYLDALREFQDEWCDHPKHDQIALCTMYEPNKNRYEHKLQCECCGLIRHRQGRAPSHA